MKESIATQVATKVINAPIRRGGGDVYYYPAHSEVRTWWHFYSILGHQPNCSVWAGSDHKLEFSFFFYIIFTFSHLKKIKIKIFTFQNFVYWPFLFHFIFILTNLITRASRVRRGSLFLLGFSVIIFHLSNEAPFFLGLVS